MLVQAQEQGKGPLMDQAHTQELVGKATKRLEEVNG